MKTHKREKLRQLIVESINEFERCPVGYQIYLRVIFYSNGAILSQIRYNDELISRINEENIAGAVVLDYFEYNRDNGIPDLHEINMMHDTYKLAG